MILSVIWKVGIEVYIKTHVYLRYVSFHPHVSVIIFLWKWRAGPRRTHGQSRRQMKGSAAELCYVSMENKNLIMIDIPPFHWRVCGIYKISSNCPSVCPTGRAADGVVGKCTGWMVLSIGPYFYVDRLLTRIAFRLIWEHFDPIMA